MEREYSEVFVISKNEDEKYNIGKILYNAYRKKVGGKTWDGEDMKTYDEMTLFYRNIWAESGMHLLEHYSE